MINHVIIIAEAGDNHNGDFNLAKKLALCAKEAGADYVKFQTFITDEVVTKKAEKAEYQKLNDNSESQYDMIKKLELSFSQFTELKKYCDTIGINFLSTAFDLKSVEYLKSLDLSIWKIPSGEIINRLYLEAVAKSGKDIIMSTGMATKDEINEAIEVLRLYSNKSIILLHCNTEYPTPFNDVNLLAMHDLANTFSTSVGYSDHTIGIEVSIAAVALGAKVIEKHFTLDRNMEGPDHKASIEPDELKKMINSIRNIEVALGDGVKKPSNSEMKNIAIARKSIVARKKIEKGELFSSENLAIKRPGTGISPMKIYDIYGKIAKKDFDEDDLIEI